MFKVRVFPDKITYVLPEVTTQHLPTSFWRQNRKICNQDYQISVVPKTESILVTVTLGVVTTLVTHIDDHFPRIKHKINPPHKIGYIFQLHLKLHTNTVSVAAIQVCGIVYIKKKGKHFSDLLPFCVTFPLYIHIYVCMYIVPHYINIYKTITHNMLIYNSIVK